MAETMLMENLNSQEWFKPSMGRELAESLLKDAEPGTFFVRPSSRKDHYALSYKEIDGRVIHSLIERTFAGYKIDIGESKGLEYSTLNELLSTCKFLNFSKPPTKNSSVDVSDKNIAILSEAFPDVSNEKIVHTLQMHKNNINFAVDQLLQDSQNPTSQSNQLNGFENQSSQVSNSSLSGSNSVFSIYSKISGGKADITNLNTRWLEVRPAVHLTFDTLEMNLSKILQNPSHALGKKVLQFTSNFNKKYYGPFSPEILATKYSQSVAEILHFLLSIQSTIKSKVPDFNFFVGGLWKVVEGNILPQIYSSLFTLFKSQHSEKNSSIYFLIKKFISLKTTETQISHKFHLVHDASPYRSAISIFASISSFSTVHQKVHCIIQTFYAIQDGVREYYSINQQPGPISMTIDELIPIFSYIIFKSQVPYLYSELAFIGNFLPDTVSASMEGLALAIFETCLKNLDSFKLVKQPSNNVPTFQPNNVESTFQSNNFEPTFQPNNVEPTFQSNNFEPTFKPFNGVPVFPPQPIQSGTNSFYPMMGYADQQFQQLQRSPYPMQQMPEPRESTIQPSHQEVPPPYNGFGENFVELEDLHSQVSRSTCIFDEHSLPQLPNNSGSKFETLGRVEKGYIQSLKIAPETVETNLQLSLYYESKEKPIKALQYCKRALALDPTNETAILRMKSLSKKLGISQEN